MLNTSGCTQLSSMAWPPAMSFASHMPRSFVMLQKTFVPGNTKPCLSISMHDGGRGQKSLMAAPLTDEFCNTNSIVPRASPEVFNDKRSSRSYFMNLISQELHWKGLAVRLELIGKIKWPGIELSLLQSENSSICEILLLKRNLLPIPRRAPSAVHCKHPANQTIPWARNHVEPGFLFHLLPAPCRLSDTQQYNLSSYWNHLYIRGINSDLYPGPGFQQPLGRKYLWDSTCHLSPAFLRKQANRYKVKSPLLVIWGVLQEKKRKFPATSARQQLL